MAVQRSTPSQTSFTQIRFTLPRPKPVRHGSPHGTEKVGLLEAAQRGSRCFLFALGCLSLVGCAQTELLPQASGTTEAAPPSSSTPRSSTPQRVTMPPLEQLVPYRELERSDFQAAGPPTGAPPGRAHVAAATCAYLVFDPALKFKAVRRSGEELFVADVTSLHFEARMDPACSWWDGANRFRPDDYVLEHEQIHFAIIELEARRLNSEADALAARLRSSGETSEVALQKIQRRFRREFEDAVQRTAARSKSFDEETSLGYSPEAQAEWARRVRSELEELEDQSSNSLE